MFVTGSLMIKVEVRLFPLLHYSLAISTSINAAWVSAPNCPIYDIMIQLTVSCVIMGQASPEGASQFLHAPVVPHDHSQALIDYTVRFWLRSF